MARFADLPSEALWLHFPLRSEFGSPDAQDSDEVLGEMRRQTGSQ